MNVQGGQVVESDGMEQIREGWAARDAAPVADQIARRLGQQSLAAALANAAWALGHCDAAPDLHPDMLPLAQDQKRWSEAAGVFRQLRQQTLRQEASGQKSELLDLAFAFQENLAKLLSLCSDAPSPFDPDSGRWAIACYVELLDQFDAATSVRLRDAFLNDVARSW